MQLIRKNLLAVETSHHQHVHEGELSSPRRHGGKGKMDDENEVN